MTMKALPKNAFRKLAENAAFEQYKVPNNKIAIITHFVCINVTGVAATIQVNAPLSTDAPGIQNLVKPSVSIAAGATDRCPEMVGKILGTNQAINTVAGTANAIMIDCGVTEVDTL